MLEPDCGGVSRVMRSCQSGIVRKAAIAGRGVFCHRRGSGDSALVAIGVCSRASVSGPHAVPRAGERLRFAQVGQSTYFEACALDDSLDTIESIFVEFRAGADPTPVRDALERFAPHVVLVFRPEIVPAGFFSGVNAATVGFLTEPLPAREVQAS